MSHAKILCPTLMRCPTLVVIGQSRLPSPLTITASTVCGGRVCGRRSSCPKRLAPRPCALPPTRRIGNRLNDSVAALASNGGEGRAPPPPHRSRYPQGHRRRSALCGGEVLRLRGFLYFCLGLQMIIKLFKPVRGRHALICGGISGRRACDAVCAVSHTLAMKRDLSRAM